MNIIFFEKLLLWKNISYRISEKIIGTNSVQYLIQTVYNYF